MHAREELVSVVLFQGAGAQHSTILLFVVMTVERRLKTKARTLSAAAATSRGGGQSRISFCNFGRVELRRIMLKFGLIFDAVIDTYIL